MKNILLLDSGKEWGGGTNSMLELLKRIDRARFRITVCFYRDYLGGSGETIGARLAALGIPFEVMSPPTQPKWAKLVKELGRLILTPLPGWRRRFLHQVERCWRILPLARRIARRLEEGGFDLLYLNNQPSSNQEGYLAGELARVPVVQHCRIEATLLAAEVATVNRIAAQVICVSAGVRDSLVRQGVRPELCSVVHNAIDGRQPAPVPVDLSREAGLVPGAIVIGSVGSLVRRKANHDLLQAAALVRARARECGAPRFHLLLVGDGPERAALEAQARELKLEDAITFAGFQAAPLPWVAAMDILVLASAKEGLPRVILEAMLLSKPVIASDVVGSRELVQDGRTGLLYPYGDVRQLAQRLETLLGDAAVRQRMGEAGRQVVLADFSIEHYVAGVEAHLAGAVA
ncbi:hypothetical protein B9N43_10165 [Denitratisoma sp. DHT3]|uniref:glycosyltransferase n=1 Tax=Denitratisoma sp. DHT3 TaxID=1981880 RepID=UPI00119853F6|nr:glycosyltransferase [Denitratisoma sp. DHT3]QDX81581.1 hypothetical protein B9N43_10165 [Denitratisoma sp. DHT3]